MCRELVIREEDKVGVYGKNGAGKTLLLSALAGTCPMFRGQRSSSVQAFFVPGQLVLPPLVTVEEWLRGMGLRDQSFSSRCDALLARLGFNGSSRARLRTLSVGNVRKLAIAAAFASEAKLVLIDEASLGLDQRGRTVLRELIVETAQAVVVADQLPWTASTLSRSIRVENGAVSESDNPSLSITVSGDPEQLRLLLESASQLDLNIAMGS